MEPFRQVDYGISVGRRNLGLDLSSEIPAGIAPPPPRVTHNRGQRTPQSASPGGVGIPIVITNEDGWCVPYAEATYDDREEDKQHSQNRGNSEDKNELNKQQHQMQQRNNSNNNSKRSRNSQADAADTGV